MTDQTDRMIAAQNSLREVQQKAMDAELAKIAKEDPARHRQEVAVDSFVTETDEGLRALAIRINDVAGEAYVAAGVAIERASECGKLLLQAREQVPHGEWERWVEMNLSVTPRTARRWMRLAEKPDGALERAVRKALTDQDPLLDQVVVRTPPVGVTSDTGPITPQLGPKITMAQPDVAGLPGGSSYATPDPRSALRALIARCQRLLGLCRQVNELVERHARAGVPFREEDEDAILKELADELEIVRQQAARCGVKSGR